MVNMKFVLLGFLEYLLLAICSCLLATLMFEIVNSAYKTNIPTLMAGIYSGVAPAVLPFLFVLRDDSMGGKE